MGIALGYLGIGMPEDVLDFIKTAARVDKQSGMGVPQVM